MNSTCPPSKAAKDRILRLGVAAMLSGRYPDLTMIDLVEKLVNDEAIDLTTIFRHTQAPVDDIRTGLVRLQLCLRTLVREECIKNAHLREIVFLVIATACIVLRLWSRHRILGCISRADWTMLAAWFWMSVFSISTITIGPRYRHIWNLSFRDWRQYASELWLGELTYTVAAALAKISWLLFYWDLASIWWFRFAVGTSIVYISLFGTASLFVFMFQCSPINWWDGPLDAKCVDVVLVFKVFTVLWVLGDFCVVLLPTLLVMKALTLGIRDKLLLIAMFATGLLACIAAIIRLLYAIPIVHDPDSTYKQSESGFWTQVELCLAIIISCIPAIRCLLRHYFPRAFCIRNTDNEATSISVVEIGGSRNRTGWSFIHKAVPTSTITDVEDGYPRRRGNSAEGTYSGITTESTESIKAGDGTQLHPLSVPPPAREVKDETIFAYTAEPNDGIEIKAASRGSIMS